jgi:hypothetical protein
MLCCATSQGRIAMASSPVPNEPSDRAAARVAAVIIRRRRKSERQGRS